ncbi:transcriptional regulator, TrmB [Thermoproteus uzoniensis 768-20]|uniref:Transcriptional regulator, TrmB n=1 Tax=Thermoproteus uzoniensis (strain 768-20) TaxID=999630 RepID=F2L226_THEU7|nr:winged helix-turn-helix transcriptional regulator [Thermoproteus uzoniensis]AEA12953.1 transcriptional regulator, TrmB [Thermoproteus uzoniensis 768-20]
MIWVVLLFANGSVLLVFNQTLAGSIYGLPLPSPPLSAPLVLNNGTPVPAVLNGSTLEVPVLGKALITVEYVPRVSASGGVISFNVSKGLYLIWAQGGVLLLPTVKILNYTKANGTVLLIAEGPGTIAYTIQGRRAINATVVAPNTTASTTATQTAKTTTSAANTTAAVSTAQTSTPQASQTATSAPATTSAGGSGSTESAGRTSESATSPGMSPSNGGLPFVWVLLAVAVAVAVAVLASRRRVPQLNDTDRLVLSYLRKTGGAYESDIARALGLPRTTVFKSVRRLEQTGLATVEKRDGKNFVTPK